MYFIDKTFSIGHLLWYLFSHVYTTKKLLVSIIHMSHNSTVNIQYVSLLMLFVYSFSQVVEVKHIFFAVFYSIFYDLMMMMFTYVL